MSVTESSGLLMMKPETNMSFGKLRQINAGLLNIGSGFDGAAADGRSYAKQFSGKYSHRIFKGIGHNVPQEAPRPLPRRSSTLASTSLWQPVV